MATEWTEGEDALLDVLAGMVTIAEISNRLERPYRDVVLRMRELGAGTSETSRRPDWRSDRIPRGAGYDKVSMGKAQRELQAEGITFTQYARRAGLKVEFLMKALELYHPDWFVEHAERIGLTQNECTYCKARFWPTVSSKQTCSRRCDSEARTDASYFNGARRQTVGLAEGRCQVCWRKDIAGLSSHHILGVENDPDGELLVALCKACHSAVTDLARRDFTDRAAGWENLIILVLLRRHGMKAGGGEVSTSVDIHWTHLEPGDETAA